MLNWWWWWRWFVLVAMRYSTKWTRSIKACVCVCVPWKVNEKCHNFCRCCWLLVMPPFIFSPIVVRSAMFFYISHFSCDRPQLIFPIFTWYSCSWYGMDILAQARMGRTIRRNNIENHGLSLIFVVFMKILCVRFIEWMRACGFFGVCGGSGSQFEMNWRTGTECV